MTPADNPLGVIPAKEPGSGRAQTRQPEKRGERSRIALRLSGMTRRGLFTLPLLATLAAAPAVAHPPAILSPQGEAGMVEEIESFYRALAAAVAAKDVVKLRAMYDDRFSHTHTSARTDGKDARIVSLLAGEATVELLPFRERRITLHAGGWAAVVRGLTPIRASDGKTYLVHWTQMLARRGDDAWQLIASHATRGAEVSG